MRDVLRNSKKLDRRPGGVGGGWGDCWRSNLTTVSMNIIFIATLQIFATIPLAFLVNFFGKHSIKIGYLNLSDIQSEGSLGYNLIFRILAPSAYIALLSILLYVVGFEEFVQSIWLISLWYVLLNFFILLSLGRLPLIDKSLYLFTQILAIVITYFLYEASFSKGLQAILPDSGNFRTELWMILIIFFYSVLKNYEPDFSTAFERREKYIIKFYARLMGRYSRYLQTEFNLDPFLEKIFFSIMIVESMNRSKFLRFIEKTLHPLGFIKTTGVMQVKSRKLLSDEESIKKSQEIQRTPLSIVRRSNECR